MFYLHISFHCNSKEKFKKNIRKTFCKFLWIWSIVILKSKVDIKTFYKRKINKNYLQKNILIYQIDSIIKPFFLKHITTNIFVFIPQFDEFHKFPGVNFLEVPPFPEKKNVNHLIVFFQLQFTFNAWEILTLLFLPGCFIFLVFFNSENTILFPTICTPPNNTKTLLNYEKLSIK